MRERNKSGAPASNLEVHDPNNAVKLKLPKILLPRFKREVMKFRLFCDRYESAVYNNRSLSAVNKSAHTAGRSGSLKIEALALTDVNYQAAVELLKSTYGNTQQIISTHVDQIYKLPPCTGEKTQQLHTIYDKVCVNI